MSITRFENYELLDGPQQPVRGKLNGQDMVVRSINGELVIERDNGAALSPANRAIKQRYDDLGYLHEQESLAGAKFIYQQQLAIESRYDGEIGGSVKAIVAKRRFKKGEGDTLLADIARLQRERIVAVGQMANTFASQAMEIESNDALENLRLDLQWETGQKVHRQNVGQARSQVEVQNILAGPLNAAAQAEFERQQAQAQQEADNSYRSQKLVSDTELEGLRLKLNFETQTEKSKRQQAIIDRAWSQSKHIADWRNQIDALQATTPEETFKVLARTYSNFLTNYQAFSSASSPEAQAAEAESVNGLASSLTQLLAQQMFKR